ncbi:MAG: hypothetical protein KDH96_13800 [Candidatus Riesia sp.]|nr:hypothetical protein [Candidatus Riesia sp.]
MLFIFVFYYNINYVVSKSHVYDIYVSVESDVAPDLDGIKKLIMDKYRNIPVNVVVNQEDECETFHVIHKILTSTILAGGIVCKAFYAATRFIIIIPFTILLFHVFISRRPISERLVHRQVYIRHFPFTIAEIPMTDEQLHMTEV